MGAMNLTEGPRRSALAVVLLLSLGGNAFLGGYLFGRGGPTGDHPPFGFPGGPPPGMPGGPPGGPPRPDHMAERLLEKLSGPDAAVVRTFLDENRAFFDAEDQRRRGFPGRLRAALTAEPFDAAAFERVLAEHDEGEYQAHRRLRQALTAAAAALSPEARRLLTTLEPPRPPPPPPRW
jgi:uncharacterized membrane protein